jgi:hypothetical protein
VRLVWLRSRGAHPDEGVDVGGLVAAGEAALVAVPVRGDVLPVPEAQLLDRLLDHLVPAVAPHRLGAARTPGSRLTRDTRSKIQDPASEVSICT